MSSLLLLSLLACDRSGEDKVAQPDDNFPPVLEIGQLEVMSLNQLAELQSNDGVSWCNDSASVARDTVGTRTQEDDVPLCHYGQLGVGVVGTTGGSTFTFKGTGGDVCLIVDPETVFWNRAIAAENPTPQWVYPDVEEDDGDIDVFAGLSAFYTGSPGIEIGDFKGIYTDSLGNQIEIEYGLCTQAGAQPGTEAHAGRATAEFCTIDTEALEGVEFTVVLETFSVPPDDAVLSFAAIALDGSCSQVNECTLRGESLDKNSGTTRDCTTQLEDAFCNEAALPAFCCTNPEMCGEDFDFNTCDTVIEEYEVSDVDELADSFCGGGACCDD